MVIAKRAARCGAFSCFSAILDAIAAAIPSRSHETSTTCTTQSRRPGLEHRLDRDVASARALDHRRAIPLGQNSPDARHQPLQHRPVEPVGTAEAVHHPGLDMALLRMPRVLGEGRVPHHAAVLVPPLARSKVHAHPDSMLVLQDRARTGNSCAHMLSRRNGRPPKVESLNFNNLLGRRRPNPPEICPTTASSGLAVTACLEHSGRESSVSF